MKNLLAKLLLAQKKIEPIVKSEKNPYYKSNYFDINAVIADVKPILSDVGLVILQPLTNLEGKPAIKTIVADPESGETMESVTPLIENADPQKMGAIITYLRRYALTSFLCLQGEDDDGNAASGKAVKHEQPYEQPFYSGEDVRRGREADDVASKPLQEGNVCPDCQIGTMKLRKGPKGQFLGCSAYPNCKHTAQI